MVPAVLHKMLVQIFYFIPAEIYAYSEKNITRLPQVLRTDLDRLNFRKNWQHQYVLGIKLITPRVKI